MNTTTMKRLDYNWERRLRRALNKQGCSLHKKRIAIEHYRGEVYTISDSQTGEECETYFTLLYKVQRWYESTFC